MRVRMVAEVLCGVLSLGVALAGASEWGDLRGRFVYDGQPPERKPLAITADIEFCGSKNLREEHLVVHPTNKGVANVIVWMHLGRRDATPAVHESHAATAKAEVDLDASNCRFDPHVCLLRTSQTLVLHNRNPIGDSVKIDTLFNPPINLMLPIESVVRHRFTDEERMPARVSCSVHPWESGWLLVKELPYMAVSDENGEFTISHLPTGKWTFQFWHERSDYVSEVKIGGQTVNWLRGRVEIDIPASGNDLGTILLAPRLFEKGPGEAVKKLGQAPRDRAESPSSCGFCSEPVPFFHSLGA